MLWIRFIQITPEDAKPLIEEKNALLVDARNPKDYVGSHADGAILADKQQVH